MQNWNRSMWFVTLTHRERGVVSRCLMHYS
uniref:Uncharacterized protein n=1 Tax=Anguilla anguilla TaxID=7936 RepID=A0A0E9QI41_ANGAN